MSALVPPATPPREMPMFPDWLDLPEGYLVQDWIAWKKGMLIAEKLRKNPALVELAKSRLLKNHKTSGQLRGCDSEWLELLNSEPVETISRILECPDDEGQRLRSSSPFVGKNFLEPHEKEAILERAYGG